MDTVLSAGKDIHDSSAHTMKPPSGTVHIAALDVKWLAGWVPHPV